MSKTPKEKKSEVSDLVVIKEKASGMQRMLDTTQVASEDDLKSVAEKIKGVKLLKKFITEQKEKYTAPAKAIIAEAREQYDPYIKVCENAEETLKGRAKTYMLEQERKAKIEEDRIAARVEKGTLKPETAMRKMEALPEVQKTVRSDAGSALRMSKRKVAKIVGPEDQQKMLSRLLIFGLEKLDELNNYDKKETQEIKRLLIPPEYWVIDDVRVRREALDRDKKGLPPIPGVVIVEEADLSSL